MKLDAIFKLKNAWSQFCSTHPKVPSFMDAVQKRGFPEGTDIDINITYPDGKTIRGGIIVKQSDIELFETLKDINPND